MNIYRKRVCLIEDVYAYAGRASDEENVKTFKTEIQKYINILKDIIETDFKCLTDKELYELLSKIYSISLDKEDYLKMLSKYNNKNYTFIYKMPTTMTFEDIITEYDAGHFDSSIQLFQVYYVIAASDNFKFDYNKVYSKEEIRDLLLNKNIVILNESSEAVYVGESFVQEKYKSIPTLDINIEPYGDNISQFVLNNFSLFGKLLRKKINKKIVLKDIKEIINDLNVEIQDIISDAQSNKILYSDTAKMCKDWYESSEEKREYQNIQKKLAL